MTVTADGSAFAMVVDSSSYLAAEVEAYAFLSLVLQLDAPYAYEFSTGPLNVGYNEGATLVEAAFGEIGAQSALFWSDTIVTGCDFGCASLSPYEGSFTGLLAPGFYRLNVSARVDRLRSTEAIAAFEDARFVLTPVPAPAAVWLFGGALGALGLIRRKMQAAKQAA